MIRKMHQFWILSKCALDTKASVILVFCRDDAVKICILVVHMAIVTIIYKTNLLLFSYKGWYNFLFFLIAETMLNEVYG